MSPNADDAADRVLQVVLETWRKVLEKPGLGPDDDFFSAGGHSMLALRIVFELEDRLEADIPVDMLFEHATARLFAGHLASEGLAGNTKAAG